jgi:hypothetical protein
MEFQRLMGDFRIFFIKTCKKMPLIVGTMVLSWQSFTYIHRWFLSLWEEDMSLQARHWGVLGVPRTFGGKGN